MDADSELLAVINKSDFKRKLEPGERVRITDINGLNLVISGTGKQTSFSFEHRCTFNGKRIVKKIRAETLEEARKIALDRYTKAKSGLHPDGIAECDLTLAHAVSDYQALQKQKKISQATEKKLNLTINKYLKPHFDYPLSKIKARTVCDLILRPIIDNGCWDMVTYVKRLLQKVMQLARAKYPEWNLDGLFEIDMLIQKPAGTKQHHPAMTDGDSASNIRSLYDVFRCISQMSSRCLCELSLHLLLRPSEIVELQVTDVNMQSRVLTVQKTKTIRDGSGFRVPLSDQAVKLLNIAISAKKNPKNPYLFESRQQLNGHMNHETVNTTLKRHGFKGIQTAHGFRAVGRTWMESQNVKFEVAEMCLSHKTGNSTVNAYRRTDYLEERKAVMQRWSDFITESSQGMSLA